MVHERIREHVHNAATEPRQPEGNDIIRMSDGPLMCKDCGQEIRIGDWPMCPHGAIREADARRFDPIVVWQSDSESDKYSFPGQAEEPVPEGYHRVEITNLREADRLVQRVNAIERAKSIEMRALNYQALDEQVKIRRESTLAHIRGNPRAEALFRAAREWADRRRAEKRSQQRMEPNFHINVFSFDSGNRNSYSGPETGWRERKK